MNSSITTTTVYEIVVFPPGSTSRDERVRYQSRTPFQSFSVGDEVTAAMLGEQSRGSDRPAAVVSRIVREVSRFVDPASGKADTENLDTTWIYTKHL